MYTYQPYNDPKGKYHFQASNGSIFETELQAAEYCQKFNAYFQAMEPVQALPWQLTRQEYETACSQLKAPVATDKECDSYGVRYGEYTPPNYSPTYAVQMALARKRLNGIEAERKAAKSQPRRQQSSLGTSCQDCYDRMSN